LGALASYLGFQVNGLFEWNFGDAEIAMLLWLTVGLALSAQKIGACVVSHGREASDDFPPILPVRCVENEKSA
jgi:hypothetical protein